MIIFETERLVVRRYAAADFDDFYRLNSDEDVMRYIRPLQSKKKSKEFFEKVIADYTALPGLGRWGMYRRADNSFVGSFAIIPVEHSDEIQLGYALLKENWGLGYASESVKAGIVYAFTTLGLTQIAGITYPENIPSQNVLLKNGFVFGEKFMEDDKELNLYRLYKS